MSLPFQWKNIHIALPELSSLQLDQTFESLNFSLSIFKLNTDRKKQENKGTLITLKIHQ